MRGVVKRWYSRGGGVFFDGMVLLFFGEFLCWGLEVLLGGFVVDGFELEGNDVDVG